MPKKANTIKHLICLVCHIQARSCISMIQYLLNVHIDSSSRCRGRKSDLYVNVNDSVTFFIHAVDTLPILHTVFSATYTGAVVG